MKKRWFVQAAVVLLWCFSSCAGQPSFSGVQGKPWKLVEVKSDPAAPTEAPRDPILFDRLKLKAEGMDDLFVLTFDSSAQVNGKAAPETYTASYQQGAGQALSFQELRSVRVERDVAPERLREADYFALLERISRWDHKEGKLELYSTDPDGRGVVLTFILE
jgi:hypothetical protein